MYTVNGAIYTVTGRLCVPTALREQLIAEVHSNDASTHRGAMFGCSCLAPGLVILVHERTEAGGGRAHTVVEQIFRLLCQRSCEMPTGKKTELHYAAYTHRWDAWSLSGTVHSGSGKGETVAPAAL